MRRMLTGALWAIGLWWAPSALSAQQPRPCARDSAHAAMQARMAEWDQRLEQKLAEADRTKGDKKVAAMGEVIRELIAQRRQMHEGMGGGRGMPGGCPGMPGAGHSGHPMPTRSSTQGMPCPMQGATDTGRSP